MSPNRGINLTGMRRVGPHERLVAEECFRR